MPDDLLQRQADLLAARVEALAEVLHAGGVSDEASAQLLRMPPPPCCRPFDSSYS